MIGVGVSYDLEQYERLQGNRPALINLFTLKAIAHKMRRRHAGLQFRSSAPSSRRGSLERAAAPPSVPGDVVGVQDVKESAEELLPPRSAEGSSQAVVDEGPSNLLGLYTIFVHPMCVLLVCVPLGLLSPRLGWGVSCTFWLNFLALIPLAKILGDATEELAASLGNETVSGLLNASFGNAVEMIVSVQALRANLLPVVKLSLLGSVLSNILLVLGSAFLLGGLTPSRTQRSRTHSILGTPIGGFIGVEKEQKFALKSALISVAMLLFSCMSFALPTMFDSFTHDHAKVLTVSRIGAWIVMSTYVAFLLFQLLTHTKTLSRDENGPVGGVSSAGFGYAANSGVVMTGVMTEEGDDDEEEEAEEEEAASMSVWCAVALMAVCATVTALNSQLLVDVIKSVVKQAGIPETFIGVILLPIAGNACEHASALRFSMNDRPGLAIGIAVGSSTQVALLVVPFAVIMGFFMGKPLDLNFGALNTLVVTFSVLVTLTLLLDGRSNWMKGYLLIALYVFIATLYWYIPYGTE
uniref:Sodium/calcium exchanger membrane region domain-containing protein n=1 Tax=Alexandrium monilatum TaxID=311494 RepID=A0A7S4QR37_9DINO|mmetsp:Transcript_19388/g.58369  ORF Transcript_19388/g.58369 Transcript_19388/m.58369 type:complete len:524 (+) Transcript_19388:76-1647(+)